jgi:formylglycine-generating enzyme required for sulfatase activity
MAVAPFDARQAKEHQRAWADHLGVPVDRKVDLPGGQKLTLVLIPPGEFMMGSSEEEQARFLEEARAANDQWAVDGIPSEVPQHRVRITKPFYLGKHEVTQAQWEAVMRDNPSKLRAPTYPVEQVSWDDIQSLLEKLNAEHEKHGMKFALPSEAQWEYACRAGTTTPWQCGDSDGMLGEFAWVRANSAGKNHPVGALKSNAWGLHDMHGNVREWCADWYVASYYADSPPNDPSGPPTGRVRVLRGGDRGGHPWRCRSSYLDFRGPGQRFSFLGFRLASVLADE